MSSARIRPISQDDWSSFEILDQETFPDDRVTKKYFDLYLASDGFYALESDNGDLLGYVKITDLKDGTGFMSRIAVAKAQQRQGLGSKLMEFCLQWFRTRNIRQVDLNTQDFNESAQRLYQKFGFNRIGTMWHYFFSFKALQSASHRYHIQLLQPEEIDLVYQLFPETMGLSRIRLWLERDDLEIYTLKNRTGNIVGACRFTPSFPGCSPFELKHLDGLDDFVAGLRPLIPQEFDYIRLTFTNNPELAKTLEERRCKLHHRLYQMRLRLEG